MSMKPKPIKSKEFRELIIAEIERERERLAEIQQKLRAGSPILSDEVHRPCTRVPVHKRKNE